LDRLDDPRSHRLCQFVKTVVSLGSNLIPKPAKNENGLVVEGRKVGGVATVPHLMPKLKLVENESKW
jgi:hypothetical protein